MPESFLFRANVWKRSAKAIDAALPTAEMSGVHGVIPELRVMPSAQVEPVSPDHRVARVGPWAYTAPNPAIECADVLVPAR